MSFTQRFENVSSPLPWIVFDAMRAHARDVQGMTEHMRDAAERTYPPGTVYSLRAGIPFDTGLCRSYCVVPVERPEHLGFHPAEGYYVVGHGKTGEAA